MPTIASISTARASAAFLSRPSCRRSVSPSWRPTLSTGLRLVIGSWKTMLMALPRILRISRSEQVSSSLPWRRTEPAILPGGSGISRRIDMAVTDLPQPLSPTIASASPSSTWNETPSTARLTPSGVRKCVRRFATSSRAIGLQPLCHARIERIAQPVAEQVHGEDGGGQERRREEYDKGLHLPERAALGHDVAP